MTAGERAGYSRRRLQLPPFTVTGVIALQWVPLQWVPVCHRFWQQMAEDCRRDTTATSKRVAKRILHMPGSGGTPTAAAHIAPPLPASRCPSHRAKCHIPKPLAYR